MMPVCTHYLTVGSPNPSHAGRNIRVHQDNEVVPTGYPLDRLVKRIPKVAFFAGALIDSGSIAYHIKDTPLDFPSSWMRTFINLALMHSITTSPLSIPATLDSLTAKPTLWFPFSRAFLILLPSETYRAAVKALCPSRLTTCNPMTSQPASSQVFRITSPWPMPFVPLKANCER